MSFDRQSPEIEYPTRWGYRIVGSSEEALRALVAEVCGDEEHIIHSAQPSRSGTYVSVRITVVVRDEAHRGEVYRRLTEAEIVKMVL